MFFISDKAIIKDTQIAILRIIPTKARFTNLSSYPVTVYGSNDGSDYSVIATLDKNQSKTLSSITKYLRLVGREAQVYVYSQLPITTSKKPDLVVQEKPFTIADGTTLKSILLLNATGTKTIATLTTLMET